MKCKKESIVVAWLFGQAVHIGRAVVNYENESIGE